MDGSEVKAPFTPGNDAPSDRVSEDDRWNFLDLLTAEYLEESEKDEPPVRYVQGQAATSEIAYSRAGTYMSVNSNVTGKSTLLKVSEPDKKTTDKGAQNAQSLASYAKINDKNVAADSAVTKSANGVNLIDAQQQGLKKDATGMKLNEPPIVVENNHIKTFENGTQLKINEKNIPFTEPARTNITGDTSLKKEVGFDNLLIKDSVDRAKVTLTAAERVTAQPDVKTTEYAKLQPDAKAVDYANSQPGLRKTEYAKLQPDAKAVDYANSQPGQKTSEYVKLQPDAKAIDYANSQPGQKTSEYVSVQTSGKAVDNGNVQPGQKTTEYVKAQTNGNNVNIQADSKATDGIKTKPTNAFYANLAQPNLPPDRVISTEVYARGQAQSTFKPVDGTIGRPMNIMRNEAVVEPKVYDPIAGKNEKKATPVANFQTEHTRGDTRSEPLAKPVQAVQSNAADNWSRTTAMQKAQALGQQEQHFSEPSPRKVEQLPGNMLNSPLSQPVTSDKQPVDALRIEKSTTPQSARQSVGQDAGFGLTSKSRDGNQGEFKAEASDSISSARKAAGTVIEKAQKLDAAIEYKSSAPKAFFPAAPIAQKRLLDAQTEAAMAKVKQTYPKGENGEYKTPPFERTLAKDPQISDKQLQKSESKTTERALGGQALEKNTVAAQTHESNRPIRSDNIPDGRETSNRAQNALLQTNKQKEEIAQTSGARVKADYSDSQATSGRTQEAIRSVFDKDAAAVQTRESNGQIKIENLGDARASLNLTKEALGQMFEKNKAEAKTREINGQIRTEGVGDSRATFDRTKEAIGQSIEKNAAAILSKENNANRRGEQNIAMPPSSHTNDGQSNERQASAPQKKETVEIVQNSKNSAAGQRPDYDQGKEPKTTNSQKLPEQIAARDGLKTAEVSRKVTEASKTELPVDQRPAPKAQTGSDLPSDKRPVLGQSSEARVTGQNKAVEAATRDPVVRQGSDSVPSGKLGSISNSTQKEGQETRQKEVSGRFTPFTADAAAQAANEQKTGKPVDRKLEADNSKRSGTDGSQIDNGVKGQMPSIRSDGVQPQGQNKTEANQAAKNEGTRFGSASNAPAALNAAGESVNAGDRSPVARRSTAGDVPDQRSNAGTRPTQMPGEAAITGTKSANPSSLASNDSGQMLGAVRRTAQAQEFAATEAKAVSRTLSQALGNELQSSKQLTKIADANAQGNNRYVGGEFLLASVIIASGIARRMPDRVQGTDADGAQAQDRKTTMNVAAARIDQHSADSRALNEKGPQSLKTNGSHSQDMTGKIVSPAQDAAVRTYSQAGDFTGRGNSVSQARTPDLNFDQRIGQSALPQQDKALGQRPEGGKLLSEQTSTDTSKRFLTGIELAALIAAGGIAKLRADKSSAASADTGNGEKAQTQLVAEMRSATTHGQTTFESRPGGKSQAQAQTESRSGEKSHVQASNSKFETAQNNASTKPIPQERALPDPAMGGRAPVERTPGFVNGSSSNQIADNRTPLGIVIPQKTDLMTGEILNPSINTTFTTRNERHIPGVDIAIAALMVAAGTARVRAGAHQGTLPTTPGKLPVERVLTCNSESTSGNARTFTCRQEKPTAAPGGEASKQGQSPAGIGQSLAGIVKEGFIPGRGEWQSSPARVESTSLKGTASGDNSSLNFAPPVRNEDNLLQGAQETETVKKSGGAAYTISGAVNASVDYRRMNSGEAGELSEAAEEISQDESQSSPKHTTIYRPTWLISPGETLVGIAERLFGDPQLGWLIADLNSGKFSETWIDGKRVIEIQSRQKLELPVWQDIAEFHQSKPDNADADNLITVVTESMLDRDLLCSDFNAFIAGSRNHVRPSKPALVPIYRPGASRPARVFRPRPLFGGNMPAPQFASIAAAVSLPLILPPCDLSPSTNPAHATGFEACPMETHVSPSPAHEDAGSL
ncbi:MAG TPA: hypothetical protein V6D17_20175 [Candidatus Obscuribacterales bacterium]